MGEDQKAVDIQDYVLELLDVTREEANKEVEEAQRQYEEKIMKQNGGESCVKEEKVEVVEGVKKDVSEMDVVQQHQALMNDPEFQKKINYDEIEPMSEEELGFPKEEPKPRYAPSTAPSSRKERKNKSEITQEEKDEAKPAVIEEESPFEDVPSTKKKYKL